MLICQECGCEPNQQLVCKECYDKMAMRLGNKIRSLQGEILELKAAADLVGAIAKAEVSKRRESKGPADTGSITQAVNLLRDKQP